MRMRELDGALIPSFANEQFKTQERHPVQLAGSKTSTLLMPFCSQDVLSH